MKVKTITLAIFKVCATGGLLVAQSANAAPQTPTNSTPVEATMMLDSVTVSASPIHDHEIFDVPSQIDVLSGSAKMQKDSGSLGEMLDGIPGVNNMSAGTQSGKPVIRGLTGNRVKVLSNGQTTDYQAYGTRHLPNIDPYLSERIEVIRGPQSVLYGSEAMGGVVNVLQAPIPYGQAVSGEVASEFNTNNNETMFGAKVGAGSEKFGITAGVSVREADNFRVPNVRSKQAAAPPLTDLPVFVGEVPFTNFENQAANVGVGYQDDWGNVELRYTQWQSKQNYVGIEVEDGQYEAVGTGQKLQNDEMQLKAEFFLTDDWVLKPSWTRSKNQREAHHDLPFETMAQGKDDEEEYLDLLVERDDYKLALEHPKIGDFEGEIGFEVTEKEQTLSSGHLTPSADVSKRAVYLFEEADYDKWLIQFGARYDWHSVTAPLSEENEHFINAEGDRPAIFDASNNEQDFQIATGSLGGTYRFNSNLSLAANLATGFRAPSIFELYAGGEHGGVQAFQLGNPDLEKETSINTDLSLRWQTTDSQVVATVYRNAIDNYIYLANQLEDDGVTLKDVESESGNRIPLMKAEQTNAVIQGFELSASKRFNAQWSADMALELIDGQDTSNNRDLPLIPANNLAVNGHYKFADYDVLKNQKLSLGVKLVASQKAAGLYEPFSQFDDKPVGTASTDSYAVWNAAYFTDVKLDKQTLQLGLKVQNVFDTDYVDFLNTYKGVTLNPGRNFQFTARLNF